MLHDQLKQIDVEQVKEMVRGMADFLCRNQSENLDSNPAAGSIPYAIYQNSDSPVFGQNWNHAFGSMALLSAAKCLASIPVVLNILYEVDGIISPENLKPHCVSKALQMLQSQQADGNIDARFKGGILELPGQQSVHARSTCYSIIVLSKIIGQVEGFLTAKRSAFSPD